MAINDFFKAHQTDASGADFPQFGPLWVNTQGPAFGEVPGNVTQLGGALDASNFKTALTAISTAQTFYSKAIDAGLLNVPAKYLRFFASGLFSQPGTTASVPTFAVTLGGVAVTSVVGASSTAVITNGQWEFKLLMNTTVVGATGTVEGHCFASIQGAAALGTALPYVADQTIAPSAAIDLSGATAISLACTIAVATTAWSSFQVRQAVLELMN